VIQELDVLRLKVEHDGVDFTIGGILSYAVKHEAEVTVLQHKVAALEAQNKEQDERIMALEENMKALVLAVQNLSGVIQGTEIIAGE
jgi:alanine dehydrogenase